MPKPTTLVEPKIVPNPELEKRTRRTFSAGRPKVQMPPLEVCINPVPEDADQEIIEKGVNFPTLPRVI